MKRLFSIFILMSIAFGAYAQDTVGSFAWPGETTSDTATIYINTTLQQTVQVTGDFEGLSAEGIKWLVHKNELPVKVPYTILTKTWPLPTCYSFDSTFVYRIDENNHIRRSFEASSTTPETTPWVVVGILSFICLTMIAIMRKYQDWRKGLLMPSVFVVYVIALCVYMDWQSDWQYTHTIPTCITLVTVLTYVFLIITRGESGWFTVGIAIFSMATQLMTQLMFPDAEAYAAITFGVDIEIYYGLFAWLILSWCIGLGLRLKRFKKAKPGSPLTWKMDHSVGGSA